MWWSNDSKICVNYFGKVIFLVMSVCYSVCTHGTSQLQNFTHGTPPRTGSCHTLLLVTSSHHNCRLVQTFSLKDPTTHYLHWHLVAVEKVMVVSRKSFAIGILSQYRKWLAHAQLGQIFQDLPVQWHKPLLVVLRGCLCNN